MKKALFASLFLAFLLPISVDAAFTRNLSYGASGNDVKELQEFLTDEGVYSGPISGNFYALTRKGVVAFQNKYQITPKSGFFGPVTRTKANALLVAALAESNEDEVQQTGQIAQQIDTSYNAQLLAQLQQQNIQLSSQLNTLNQIVQNTTPTQPTPVVASPIVEVPLVFTSPQPTSFFSSHGGNIGNGSTGSKNGVPYVEITTLKSGATAALTLNGNTYQLDQETKTRFYLYDLAFDPAGIYDGTTTQYNYTINFSYTDTNNPLVTGSASGGFTLNNLKAPNN